MAKKPAHILPRGVLHSTVSGVELNDDQKTAIEQATGVQVDWILFNQSADAVARALDPSALSVTRLTWCW
jgi:hypothetical protein